MHTQTQSDTHTHTLIHTFYMYKEHKDIPNLIYINLPTELFNNERKIFPKFLMGVAAMTLQTVVHTSHEVIDKHLSLLKQMYT